MALPSADIVLYTSCTKDLQLPWRDIVFYRSFADDLCFCAIDLRFFPSIGAVYCDNKRGMTPKKIGGEVGRILTVVEIIISYECKTGKAFASPRG